MVKLARSKSSASRSHGSKRIQLKQPLDDLLGNPYLVKTTDISLSGASRVRSRSLSSATTAQNGATRNREDVPIPIMVPWQSDGMSFSRHKETAEQVIEDEAEVTSMGNSSDCEDSEISEVSESSRGTSVVSSLGAPSVAASTALSLASSAFVQALLESTGAMTAKEAAMEEKRDENAELDKELGPYLEGVKEEGEEEEEEQQQQKDVEGNDMPDPAETSAGQKLLTLFTSPINEIMGNQDELESANPRWFASQNANTHSQPAVSVWEDNPFTNLKEAIEKAAAPQEEQSELNTSSWWIVDLSFAPKLDNGATPLVSRCMREYGWDEKFARRVLLGYKQFFQLKKAFEDWDDELIRPSFHIKKMWIRHILDTRNYADDCFEIIGHHIHHRADDDEEGTNDNGDDDEGFNDEENGNGVDEEKQDENRKLTEEEMKHFNSIEELSTLEEAKALFGEKLDEEIWKFKEPKSPKSPRKSFVSFKPSFTSTNHVASSKEETMAVIAEEPKKIKKKFGWRLRKLLSIHKK